MVYSNSKEESDEGGSEEKCEEDDKGAHKKTINGIRKFAWKHENSKAWEKVKYHPDSGVKMSATNITHEDNNPCVKEYNLSMKCLHERAHERELCKIHFENYRICRTFWYEVVADRKKKGVTPHLPLPHDRERIKEAYISSSKGWPF